MLTARQFMKVQQIIKGNRMGLVYKYGVGGYGGIQWEYMWHARRRNFLALRLLKEMR